MKISKNDKKKVATVLEAVAMVLREEDKKEVVAFLKEEGFTEAKANEAYSKIQKGMKMTKL